MNHHFPDQTIAIWRVYQCTALLEKQWENLCWILLVHDDCVLVAGLVLETTPLPLCMANPSLFHRVWARAPDSARIHVRSTSPWIPWEPKWYELLVGWGISWHIQQGSWMQHNIQPNHCGIFRSIVNQWIGLRENLQESPYLMGKSMVSCKFSLKPIQSLKGILDTAGWTHR